MSPETSRRPRKGGADRKRWCSNHPDDTAIHVRCSGTWPVDHRLEADQRLDALTQAVSLGASAEALARIASGIDRHWKAETIEAAIARNEDRR